jgi:hypothetical protein
VCLHINPIEKGKRNAIPFIDYEDYSNETPLCLLCVMRSLKRGLMGVDAGIPPTCHLMDSSRKNFVGALIYCNCRPDISAMLNM